MRLPAPLCSRSIFTVSRGTKSPACNQETRYIRLFDRKWLNGFIHDRHIPPLSRQNERKKERGKSRLKKKSSAWIKANCRNVCICTERKKKKKKENNFSLRLRKDSPRWWPDCLIASRFIANEATYTRLTWIIIRTYPVRPSIASYTPIYFLVFAILHVRSSTCRRRSQNSS